MYEDWGDSDEWVADLIDDHIRHLQEAPAFDYLARNGDAIEARVRSCIDEARALLGAGYASAALVSAGTAIELTVRFFLVRPLLHGAFLSDEWAAILGARILTPGPRGPAADRELLPAILRNWGIDITGIRTKQGRQAWEETTKPGGVVDTRNNYVHRGQPAPAAACEVALECATLLLAEVVDPLATRLGFTRQETHSWRTVNPIPPASCVTTEEQEMYRTINPPRLFDTESPF